MMVLVVDGVGSQARRRCLGFLRREWLGVLRRRGWGSVL